MRLVMTRLLNENDKLSKPVFHESGAVLIHAGVPLTKRMINRLIELGISYVYIDDSRTRDVVIHNSISDETRRKAYNTLKKEFVSIAEINTENKVIDTLRLSKQFNKVVQGILKDIKKNEDVISILSDVFYYDTYIFNHSLNVTIYTVGLGMELGFTQKQLLEIGLGALLHDVGKMMIPKHILNKKGGLTKEEFEQIKDHSKAGFDILRSAPNISLLTAHCAFQHHERMNGSGYPQGLTSRDIHLYAKIIAIADVFDAITSNRVYRDAMLPHEGLEILYTGVDELFDKKLVELFSRTVAIYPVGVTVYLSDSRKGVVVKQNKNFATRPVVRIIGHNKECVTPYEVDLMKEVNVTIVECEARVTNNQ
ncbi:MAG: HD-GYP domain-containing protein [Bacillaceae bacterium]|nr:HD-GYP domain-containing protein [Bacillaceae bacterium]